MAEKAVLFDVENTLVREAKDVSQYYYEAIRSSYGLSIEGIKLSEYEGMTVQETLIDILTKYGLAREEIYQKLELFLEELPYAHYNVAGHDRAVLVDGAKGILGKLHGRDGYVVGAASGQLERILRNLFDRAGMKYDAYFKFGSYGNTSEHMTKILEAALKSAEKDFGIDKHHITFISNVRRHIGAAHSLGIHSVGVITDHYSKRELESIGVAHVVRHLKEAEKFIK